jgi:hypothetical protein
MEWPPQGIFQTLSEKSMPLQELAGKFQLPWSIWLGDVHAQLGSGNPKRNEQLGLC